MDKNFDIILNTYSKELEKYLKDYNCIKEFQELPLYDKNKLKDYFFVTEHIFNAGTRKYNATQAWLLLLKNLPNMEIDNSFLSGFITVLSYRLMEEKNSRKFIIPYLFKIKQLNDRISFNKPIYSRWFISSSNTFATVLLMDGDIDEAEELFIRALSKLSFIPHTPLFMMNLCMINYQYAMILLDRGKDTEAMHQFEQCFFNAKKTLDEIYNPRNDWFLAMYSDCEQVLKLSKNSMIAWRTLNNGKLPEGSRFLNMGLNNNFRFDGLIPLNRFSNLDNNSKQWHLSVANIINDRIIKKK